MTIMISSIGDETSVLSLDDPPAVTSPDPGRIFLTPSGSGPCYIFSVGASDNNVSDDWGYFTIWGRDPEISTWFFIFDMLIIGKYCVGTDGSCVLPRNIECFAQFSSNLGISGLTKASIGVLY